MVMRPYDKRIIYPILMLILISTFVVSGCTKKDNLTGDNWSGIRPISITDSLFTDGFSFPYEGKTTGTESVMLCGNYDGKEAISVMRFTGMPSNIDTVTDAELKVVVLRRSPFDRAAITLSLHKLTQNWAIDSTAVISDESITTAFVSSIAVPNTIHNDTGDTLVISIAAEQIKEWSLTNVTGYNLVLKNESDSFVEIRSIESGNGPLLNFKYKKVGESNTRTYNSRANMDSHRLTVPTFEVTANNWTLQNLSPSRMFVKFELNPASFVDNDGVVMDSIRYKRCTINSAELVLYVKNNPYYGNLSYNIMPYNVTKDSVSAPITLTANDMELISPTTATSKIASGDSITIKITPIVQAYTSGDRVNKGIILRSQHEMLNFGLLELWHFDDPALPEGFAPKIRITYTPPYLVGNE